MPLPALSRQQSRQIDQVAIEELGLDGLVLMENAGRGITEVLLGELQAPAAQATHGHKADSPEATPDDPPPVLICCGKGNNAGDGFVIARHLAIHGYRPITAVWGDPDALQGDAATNFNILRKLGGRLEIFADGHLPQRLDVLLSEATWVVDALLGTGVQGAPRSPLDAVIRQINGSGKPVLAVDVPSGLDCDTGEPNDPTVRAAVTCTMVTPKKGFTTEVAQDYLGRLHVVQIGFPPEAAMRHLA